jgi:hypothetical protein
MGTDPNQQGASLAEEAGMPMTRLAMAFTVARPA